MEIKVVKNILDANDRMAAQNRETFDRMGLFVVNIMSSPGAGKTSLLVQTLKRVKDSVRTGVIEGDIQGDNDAKRIGALGIDVVQFTVTTLWLCPLIVTVTTAKPTPSLTLALPAVSCGVSSLSPIVTSPVQSVTTAFVAPDSAAAGQVVNFVNTSRPGSGEAVAFLWDFGHSAPLAAANPQYTYGSPGIYRVTLVVWDSSGRGARAEKKIIITE